MSQERRKIIIQFCFVNISKSYNNLHGLDPEPLCFQCGSNNLHGLDPEPLFFQCGSGSASKIKG